MLSNCIRVFWIVALLLSVQVVCFSATLYVDDDNTSGPWDGSQQYPYETIQDAIFAASNNDTILVQPGTYPSISVTSKIVYIKSVRGKSSTIIDGVAGTSSVVDFTDCGSAGTNLGIEGFTIINGEGETIGYDTGGGGIYCRDSSPIIKDNTIQSNTATLGAGILCCCNGSGSVCSPIIEYNTITNNSTTDANGKGGGICFWMAQSNITIRNNDISYNDVPYCGGGICVWASMGSGFTITISNNLIKNNTAETGGGIHSQSLGLNQIRGNTIEGNSNNGIYIVKTNNDQDDIHSNIIRLNSAEDMSGGGICLVDNIAYLTNNVIYDNSTTGSSYGYGGGIYLSGNKSRILTSNTIYDNEAEVSGGGVYVENGTNVYISHTIVWSNDADSIDELDYTTTSPTVNYSDIESPTNPGQQYTGTQNRWEDPIFIITAGNTWHLSAISNLREKGNNQETTLPTSDVDGQRRIQGVYVDIGADEY